MKTQQTHKTQVLLDLTVRRQDGSVSERRSIQPKAQEPDMCKIEVRDKAGKLTSKKEFPVKSFVENWSEILYHNMILADADFTDTGNTARVEASPNIELEAADNSDSYGIWVGTGNTAVAVGDYTLDTKIDHGTGAGELDYNQNLYVAATTDGTDTVYKIYRTFTNSSGGSITIQEVGIVANTGANYKYLILRDVEDADGGALNVAVPVGQTATVTYTLTQTQASGFTFQYLQLMESMNFDHIVHVKYVGGGGATWDYWNSRNTQNWLLVNAALGITTNGILVGTSDTALDSTDYELGTLIANGNGSGQMLYDALAGEDLAVDGDDVTFVMKRVVTNLSGATINIEEAGITVFAHGSYHFMILRLLTGTLEVQNGYSVEAKYTFKHTV